jgi:flagellar assembly protein FliH
VPLDTDEVPAFTEATMSQAAASATAANHTERERLLALALQEFEQRLHQREQVYVDGLREADARAEAKLRAEVTMAVAHLTSAVDALLAERSGLLLGAEETALRLTMAIARKIVADTVRIDEKFVLHIVRRALRYAAEAHQVVIRVHPEDLALVEAHSPEWAQAARRSRSLRIESDEQQQRGSCVIGTEACEVAAAVEDQLQVIESALVEKLTTESPGVS